MLYYIYVTCNSDGGWSLHNQEYFYTDPDICREHYLSTCDNVSNSRRICFELKGNLDKLYVTYGYTYEGIDLNTLSFYRDPPDEELLYICALELIVLRVYTGGFDEYNS